MPPRFLSLLFALILASGLRAADSVLVFNEIQYHPANEATQTEWIEFRSLQGVDVDIGGWKISGGVDYTFPDGTIMPGGGYLVVAAVQGQILGSLGPWTGKLDNGGEPLKLLNRNGRIMDEVDYDDKNDWPLGPDGSGVTLARKVISAASGASVWAPSIQGGGTPGGLNFYEGATAVRTVVAAIGDTWKYLDTGVTAPGGWQNAGFDDSSWKSGPTLITGGGAKLGGAVKPSAIPNGLLAYWAFDETSGTAAANGVAGSPAGTMANGATFVNDAARGQVASFDGVDDRMEVIDQATGLPTLNLLPAMTATNDFTWAAWVWSSTNSTLADQSTSVIMGNRTDPNGNDTVPREYIKIMPTAAQYGRNNGVTALNYPDLPVSTWTHMCVVKRGLNLDYYSNGVFVLTVALPGALVNTQLPFYVGGDRKTLTPTTTEHFAGRVDDVALWTRALSAAEIASLGQIFGPAPTLPTPPEQTTTAVTGPEPRYFRKTFTFNGTPSSATLELWPAADDGAIIYLNGTEVWRNNVPVTSEVTSPNFTPAPVIISNAALVNGTNVLSAEVDQFPGGNNDLLFGAQLAITSVPGPAPAQPPSLIFNEISGANDSGFYIELHNVSGNAVSTSGWLINTDTGLSLPLPAQTVDPGGYAVLTSATLGFVPVSGMKLFLFAPGGTELRDARQIGSSIGGLTNDGRWGHPTSPTPGGVNVVAVNTAVVINEIFYKGANDSPEQWLELYNKSAAAVDLSSWKFTDGISYTFAAGTTIPANGYLVIAWDPTAFAALHPGVSALGPWSGSLKGGGELLTLRDANDNVVNQLTFYSGGRWSEWAHGGGSSLELMDPNADNTKPEAWDSSDESGHSTWQNISYSGAGANPAATSNDATNYNEFVVELLTNGDCLVDDVSVKDASNGNVELIQNGAFSTGTTSTWRIIGNHHGSIVDDPLAAGNKVLKLMSRGSAEHMSNHAETTLKSSAGYVAINSSHTYNISLRAKWLRGTNRLHTRLWFNRLAVQTLLNMPATGGTPGAVNSRRVANLGPTYDALAHTPVVPAAGTSATVSVKVADPDGVANVQLFTSVNGAAFTSTTMGTTGGGVYSATIPGQSTGALVQFYVRATDSLGAVTTFPAAGAASRAIIPWDDGKSMFTLASGAHPHNLRVVFTTADANEFYKAENVMSNDFIPCTAIWDDREVYYQAGVRLKSSEHGRFDGARVGFVVEFGEDQLFLGTHGEVAVDRSGGVTSGEHEILTKTVSNVAGGVYATEDDIIRVIAPVSNNGLTAFTGVEVTGPALFSKTRWDDEYLGNQWSGGGGAPLFKFDLCYILTQTINTSTRAVTTVPAGGLLSALAENPKVPQSGADHPGVSVTNLGPDKEVYRWHWLIKNAHAGDDYTGLIPAVTAIGQTGGTPAFQTQTQQYVDVDHWLRAAIPANLFGIQDNYLGVATSQHNTLVFFPPGGKATLIPWDLDYLAETNAQAPLDTGGDIVKFIADPVNKRAYYGHILDILNRSFNTAFLTRWATHYSKFSSDDMTTQLSFLNARAQYARDVINGANGQTAPITPVAFARTSASPVTVGTPFATVSGVGWINIAEIRLQGSPQDLAVTWTDDHSWTLQLPIGAGTHTYTLVAYDTTGAQVGITTVTITGSGGIFPAGPGNLVVSELNYNPPGSSDATEFVELLNITGATLDLSGCHFDEELGQGIAYTFPSGVQMGPGARLLVVRDRTAFAAMYPSAGPLAPNQYTGALDNGGESLVLYAASGLEIFRFSYNDNIASTDGGGRTLVRVLSSTNPDPNSYVWRASTVDGGNPGSGDAVSFTGTPSADADKDGIPALLEYALGTSDSVPGKPACTLNRDSFGTITLVFTHAVNADDAVLGIEATADLGTPFAPATAILLSTTTAGNLATETWIITPPPGSTTFYVRLKATLR